MGFIWLAIGIHTSVLRLATLMKIPLIFYSEDGEVEYEEDANIKKAVSWNDYQISAYMESDTTR